MRRITAALFIILSVIIHNGNAFAQETGDRSKFNWQAVSDPDELNRAWKAAAVYLPESVGHMMIGQFFADEPSLNTLISNKLDGGKIPLILYLPPCGGLMGNNRDDMERFSKLGFAVIAMDPMARQYSPVGCYDVEQRYTEYYDITVAFRKAELNYAVARIKQLPWVDDRQMFLVGSGIGGMTAAHYEGTEFVGHVIEGWGCHHPDANRVGIKASPQVRIFAVVSKNDGWVRKNPGFSGDCARFLKDRADSVSMVVDRPGHFVAWHSRSRTPMIKFLTRDIAVDQAALVEDIPLVIAAQGDLITLRLKWTVQSIYSAAQTYCQQRNKTSYLMDNTHEGLYQFACM